MIGGSPHRPAPYRRLSRVSLSELRYRAGVDSRLELLDAQRQLYAVRSAVVNLRQAQAISSIGLYRALGGRVQPDEDIGVSEAERR